VFPNAYGEVLDDEVVIMCPSGSAGESEVFQPYSGIRLPCVLGNVGGWSKTRWERCFLDAASEGPWA
jgi:hypothetical protein